MKIFRVDCWEVKKCPVQVDEIAYVEGQTSWFGDGKLIKADKIVNKTRNLPTCACGEPGLNVKMEIGESDTNLTKKIFTKDIKKEGKVTSVTEKVEGFFFYMEVDE